VTESALPYRTAQSSYPHTRRTSEAGFWDSPALRIAVVLIALAVMYVRVPYYFNNTLVMGEDGVLWLQARLYGIPSLGFSFVGYLVSASRVIALVTQLFPVEYFPAIFFWTGIAVDLAVIWLLTSPRLDLPYRPIIALSVVCTAQGSDIVGVTMSHIQWTMPLGAFALMFMRPSGRISVQVAEMVLVAASALTGPFALFLAPLFPVQAFLLRNDSAAFRRLVALTAVLWIGAAAQLSSILFNVDRALQPDLHPPFHWTSAVDWGALINSVFYYFFMPIGEKIFVGRTGLVISMMMIAILGTLIVLSLIRLPRYRAAMIFMLAFSALVTLAGIIKIGAQERYLYIPGVLAIWFVCCVVAELGSMRRRQAALACVVALLAFFVLYYRDYYTLKGEPPDWPRWSKFVHSGLPLTVSILPSNWFINIPADSAGPLFGLNTWIGKRLDSLVTSSPECRGVVTSITPLKEDYYVYRRSNINAYAGATPRWVAQGRTGSAAGDIVAVTDSGGRVLGFGFSGFAPQGSDGSEWRAVSPSANSAVKIYALASDNRSACELARAD
jgi:hypothetical protein